MLNILDLSIKLSEIDTILKNICCKYNGYTSYKDRVLFNFILPIKRIYRKKELYEVSSMIRIRINIDFIESKLPLPIAKEIINKYIERI